MNFFKEIWNDISGKNRRRFDELVGKFEKSNHDLRMAEYRQELQRAYDEMIASQRATKRKKNMKFFGKTPK